MIDEDKKNRLRNVVYRLRIISNKIEDLESSISGTKETLKRSLTIDDKGLKEETLNELCNGLNQGAKSIKQNIIPSLNNKIYS